MKAFFVSDLHLKSSDDPNTAVFHKFLIDLSEQARTENPDRPTHLFLVGDIFDLWVGDHDYFIKSFSSIIDAIGLLLSNGVEVHYFEGNHDLYLEPFWCRRIGVTVHPEAEYFSLGPWRVRVEHGDQMNPADKGYLFLRWFLRTWLMKFVALRLPSAVVAAIGERASHASRNYTSTAKGLRKTEIGKIIRVHTEDVFRSEAFDFLIAGHVHIRDEQEFTINGRLVRTINLGSWFDGPKAYVLGVDHFGFLNWPT